MATATKIRLKEFNENEALNGVSLAFSSNGQLSGTAKNYVLNFQLNDVGSISERYSGQVQKKMYYFDNNGICSDGNSFHNLFIVDAEIIATSGTAATREELGVEESIDIDVLQPREYFAMYALQGILTKIENPLTLDDGQVTLISSMAFKIAQSMMSTAADYRAATQPGGTPPPSVDVDINNVTSTTDRILYNMGEQIKELRKDFTALKEDTLDYNKSVKGSLTSIKDTLSSETEKTKEVKIISMPDVGLKPGSSVDANVTNTIDANVTNTVLTTYVNNMPTVPSEPVAITGTVSVDNMPSVPVEPITITGTVSVDNFPSSGGTES